MLPPHCASSPWVPLLMRIQCVFSWAIVIIELLILSNGPLTFVLMWVALSLWRFPCSLQRCHRRRIISRRDRWACTWKMRRSSFWLGGVTFSSSLYICQKGLCSACIRPFSRPLNLLHVFVRLHAAGVHVVPAFKIAWCPVCGLVDHNPSHP